MNKPTSQLRPLLRVTELIFFGFALFMTIPPVPSEEGHAYHFLPSALIGGSGLAISLLLAGRRGAETWVTAILKLVCYLVFVWVLQERIAIR